MELIRKDFMELIGKDFIQNKRLTPKIQLRLNSRKG